MNSDQLHFFADEMQKLAAISRVPGLKTLRMSRALQPLGAGKQGLRAGAHPFTASKIVTAAAGPHIAIVCSSSEDHSRSRTLAHTYAKKVQEAGGTVDFIDIGKEKVPLYGQGSTKKFQPLLDRFNSADGWVIASPIHNWGPSATTTNFLNHALDSEGPKYKPFVLLAGAGTSRSHLALSGLAQSISTEVNGVHVGSPIIGSGTDVEPESNKVSESLHTRVAHSAAALVRIASGSKSASIDPVGLTVGAAGLLGAGAVYRDTKKAIKTRYDAPLGRPSPGQAIRSTHSYLNTPPG